MEPSGPGLVQMFVQKVESSIPDEGTRRAAERLLTVARPIAKAADYVLGILGIPIEMETEAAMRQTTGALRDAGYTSDQIRRASIPTVVLLNVTGMLTGGASGIPVIGHFMKPLEHAGLAVQKLLGVLRESPQAFARLGAAAGRAMEAARPTPGMPVAVGKVRRFVPGEGGLEQLGEPVITSRISHGQGGVLFTALEPGAETAGLEATIALYRKAGVHAQVQVGRGYWKGEYEHAVTSVFRGLTDTEHLKYLAAIEGLQKDQMMILWFMRAGKGRKGAPGPHSLYQFEYPGVTADQAAKRLDAVGLEGYTVVPTPKGARVLVYDGGGDPELLPSVRAAAKSPGSDIRVQTIQGEGGFFGGETREQARAFFDQYAAAYEQAHPDAAVRIAPVVRPGGAAPDAGGPGLGGGGGHHGPGGYAGRVPVQLAEPEITYPLKARLRELYEKGKHVFWYKGAGREIVQALGPDDGRLFGGFFAALSNEKDPASNLDFALQAYKAYKAGGIDALRSLKVADASLENLEVVARWSERGFPGAHPPFSATALKITHFYRATMGDMSAFTVDRHISRIFFATMDTLSEQQTKGVIDFSTKLAKEWRTSPSHLQEAIWVAWREENGLPSAANEPLRRVLKAKLTHDPEMAGLLRPEYLKQFRPDAPGQADLGATLALARVIVGATAGGAIGDTAEERVRNSFIGAGLGAVASPALVRSMAKSVTRMMANERGSLGPFAPKVDPVKIVAATRAEAEAFMLVDPSAINLGDRALAIDWSALDSGTVKVEDLITKLVATGGEKIDEARRGIITDARRRQLADMLGMTVDDVTRLPIGTALNAEQMQAVINLDGAIGRRIGDLSEQVAHSVGNDRTLNTMQLQVAIGAGRKVTQALYGARAEWGRTGRVLQDAAQVTQRASMSPGLTQVGELQERGLLVNPEIVAEYVSALRPVEERGSFIRGLFRKDELWATEGGTIRPPVGQPAIASPTAAPPGAPVTTPSRGAPPVAGPAAPVTPPAAPGAPPVPPPTAPPATPGTSVYGVLRELWYGSLLSGYSMHTANMATNALKVPLQFADTAVAGAIGQVRSTTRAAFGLRTVVPLQSGAQARVYEQELIGRTVGMFQGFTEGFLAMGRALWTGESKFGAMAGKVPHEPAITAQNLGLSSAQLGWSGVPGRAVDALGLMTDAFGGLVRSGGRLLMSGDELAKFTHYRMEIGAQAIAESVRQGVAWRDRPAFYRAFTGNVPPYADVLAREAAQAGTFTTDLTGAAASISKGIEESKFGVAVVPFLKVSYNILDDTLQHMLVFGLASKAWRADIAAGGARMDLALAKQAVGSLMLGSFAALAVNGDITGLGPLDKGLRQTMMDAGWQPYSVRIGADYYSYNRLGPFGSLLGFSADAAELIPQLREPRLADGIVTALALTFSHNFFDQSYMSGVHNILDAIMSSTPKDPEKDPFLRGLLRSTVPAGVAQLTPLFDPMKRETETLLDEMRSRIPGFSQDLPAHRDLFGYPTFRDDGYPAWMSVASAVKHRQLRDPETDERGRLYKELQDNGISISRPPKYIFGSDPGKVLGGERPTEGIRLDGKQYEQYAEMAGHALKLDVGFGGPMGQDTALRHLIEQPWYLAMSPGPDGSRAVAIRQVIEAYREAAKWKLLKENPALAHEYSSHIGMRASALLGTNAQENEIRQAVESGNNKLNLGF